MAGLLSEQEGACCDKEDTSGASQGWDFSQNDERGKNQKDRGECEDWYTQGEISCGKCPIKEDCCHDINGHGCSYRWKKTRAERWDAEKEDQGEEDQGSGKKGIPGKEKRRDSLEEHLY